jgi:ABC-type Fe3+-hydroxamate transport system substrate-binding protein
MILQNTGDLGSIPKRIISLVPSQTELLHYLGLETETVGITKFCIHPAAWFHNKTRVGGTKAVNIKLVQQLKPDVIIANKEENVKEQVEELAKDHAVLVTDVNNLEDALKMIRDIAELTGKTKKAFLLADEIITRFNHLGSQPPTTNPKPQTAYLIWRDPYMTVGGDTFINDMLLKCGLDNVFANRVRYPEISVSELRTANCKLILLSSEPYPFKEKHIDELSKQLPGCKIILADGEMFSWYGSRLLLAPEYFIELSTGIHKP